MVSRFKIQLWVCLQKVQRVDLKLQSGLQSSLFPPTIRAADYFGEQSETSRRAVVVTTSSNESSGPTECEKTTLDGQVLMTKFLNDVSDWMDTKSDCFTDTVWRWSFY